MGAPNSFKIDHYVACHVRAASLTSSFVKAKSKSGSQKMCPKSEDIYAFGF
jgi:hypothetical protein